MQVIVKEPRRSPELKNIDDGDVLKALQDIVDGYIETYPLGPGLVIILNEEGKLRGLRSNLIITRADGPIRDILVGTIAVVGIDGEDFTGITDPGVIRYVRNWLDARSID